jgi:hypothetical protein
MATRNPEVTEYNKQTTFRVPNIGLWIVIFLVAAVLFILNYRDGITFETELHDIVDQYASSPTTDHASSTNLLDNITAIMSKIHDRRRNQYVRPLPVNMTEDEKSSLEPIIPILVDRGEYEFLNFLARAGVPISNDDIIRLHHQYTGKSPEINYLIAEELRRFPDRLRSTYNRAVVAAIGDPDTYAKQVRGLLHHYGCKAEDHVWSEFSSRINYALVLGGEKYPDLPLPPGFEHKLPLLKMKLRAGIAPGLSDNCPINLYN